ncbi:MAG: shikimate dehydrogenase [Methylovulum sp.]|jgi:shikimate dehydrogenase|nr:shikimate dehydrogenase [Methylovulum sp.]
MSVIDRYAVFGHPIQHSKSPRIHRLFAEQTGQILSYTAQEVLPEHFHHAVSTFFANGGKGINCTVPLKELAWQYACQSTPRAALSKAVNTLILQDDATLLGDNTDGCGLLTDLTVNHQITLAGQQVLIIGAGGASRGIIAHLIAADVASIIIVNRTLEKAIQLAHEFNHSIPVTGLGFADLSGYQFDLIINATSASLTNQLPPLSNYLLAPQGICYDLAYSNEDTAFVRWGQQQLAQKSLDGLGMLVEQAAEAFFLWRKVRPDTQTVIALLNAERTHTP